MTSSTSAAALSPESVLNQQWATLCVVATTVASAEQAQDMARAIVAARAAACVQAEPITSYYEWEGVFETTPEWRLVCKTLPAALAPLTRLIQRLHGYEVPQITMRTERCLPDYAQWLRSQVA